MIGWIVWKEGCQTSGKTEEICSRFVRLGEFQTSQPHFGTRFVTPEDSKTKASHPKDRMAPVLVGVFAACAFSKHREPINGLHYMHVCLDKSLQDLHLTGKRIG